MHDDALSAQIQRLIDEARPGPAGVFSLDLKRVEMVFGAAGDDWFHYWLRFAAFYGAASAEVVWDGTRFELSFVSPGPDLEELRALLLHRQRGPRYLALGMLAAAQQGLQDIVLEAPHGSLTLEAFDETRRSRDGLCRIRARFSTRGSLPELVDLRLPVCVNGRPLPPGREGRGLRLLVDGFAFDWEGLPLLPPGENLDWSVSEVRLDARLRQLVQPALSEFEVKRLQEHFGEELRRRPQPGPEAVEWLLLRAHPAEFADLLQQLPAPPADHALAPAYYERRQASLGDSLPERLWERWPSQCWPGLLNCGLAPFSLPLWLAPSCARLPGRAVYPYLLRSSWLGEHFDAPYLQALLSERRDTLGGNVLLAQQLRQLKPAQRPAEAARFCLEFLRAVVKGEETSPEWAPLSADERASLLQLTEDLGA